ASDLVDRRAVTLEQPFALPGGLTATLFAVPGKLPLYREGESVVTDGETAANVGVELTGEGARLAFVPGCAAMPQTLKERLGRGAVVRSDAQLYADEGLIGRGAGERPGSLMGLMPIAGRTGSLAALADLAARRVYLHINNTNPILVENSPERRRVEAAGWAV